MKNKKNALKLLLKLCLIIVLGIVIGFIFYSNYIRQKSDEIILKSRYTFQVRMDKAGNVYDENEKIEGAGNDNALDNIDISKAAEVWLRQFTQQYTQKYVSWSMALRDVEIKPVTVLDRENNVVMLSFSAELKDSASEYFESWDGGLSNGRMHFEWVVKFVIEDHYDLTFSVYVKDMKSPKEYGIDSYNEDLKKDNNSPTESATSENNNKLMTYEIKNNSLLVSYNGGGKYITVPVDVAGLCMAAGNNTSGVGQESQEKAALAEGSWCMNDYATAFLYGGKTQANTKLPVTLIYSMDKGENWITCEIEKIYDADYFYVNFFDSDNGIIVVGYASTDKSQSSRIYKTEDGGLSWNSYSSAPANNILKGVKYIDANWGFFCYNYVEGMDSNLYMTKDGGHSFSKIVFEEQELDSSAANSHTDSLSQTTASTAGTAAEGDMSLTGKFGWRDVYKEALLPIYDNNVLTVYLTQGDNGVYNNGKTAAKYQSFDKGESWEYVGQLEISG